MVFEALSTTRIIFFVGWVGDWLIRYRELRRLKVPGRSANAAIFSPKGAWRLSFSEGSRLRLEAELRARVGNIGMGSSSPASSASCNTALGSLGGDDQLAIEPAAIVLAAAARSLARFLARRRRSPPEHCRARLYLCGMRVRFSGISCSSAFGAAFSRRCAASANASMASSSSSESKAQSILRTTWIG